jgi:hypothetical protein
MANLPFYLAFIVHDAAQVFTRLSFSFRLAYRCPFSLICF